MANELWAAVIGVAGALAGVWYGARLSRNAARELLEDQARAEFAVSFADTLVRLARGSTDPGIGEALQILNADYLRHLAAYTRFRVLLQSERQQALDRAWKEYTNEDSYELREEAEIYRFMHVLEPKHEEHQFALAIKHVNALLAKTAA